MKVLMVINTSGLDYDDRLRKESLSLRSLGYEVEIVALESANEARQRVAYDHIPATTIRLRSRNLFASAKGLALKAAEMYFQFLRWTWRSRPEIVWFHNLEMLGMAPVFALMRKAGIIKRLVWDQHELPADTRLSSPRFLLLLRHLCNGCDVVVCANSQRRQLLHGLLGRALHTPLEVLDNYPDRLLVELPMRDLPTEAREWLAGRPYVLAQGGAAPNRHLDKVVSAVLGIPDLGLIVIGPYKEAQIQHLRKLYGRGFDERVLLTGFVPQMDVVPYIDHALLSVVLYEMSSENRRLCAPNRLYQAVSRGIPAVVGANPGMVDFVRQWECGVVLKTDGGDEQDIRWGILKACGQQDRLRQNARKCQESITWESQVPTIARIADVAADGQSKRGARDAQRGPMAGEPSRPGEEQERC